MDIEAEVDDFLASRRAPTTRSLTASMPCVFAVEREGSRTRLPSLQVQ